MHSNMKLITLGTLQKEQRKEQSNETETTSNESENSYSCPICSKKFRKVKTFIIICKK